jgi:outer membrane protein
MSTNARSALPTGALLRACLRCVTATKPLFSSRPPLTASVSLRESFPGALRDARAVSLALLLPGLLLLTGATVAPAAEVRLSLADALDKALFGNRALQAAYARAGAAHSRSDQTDRLSWPRVSLTSQLSSTDDAAMVFMGKLTSGVIDESDFARPLLNDPRSRFQMSTRLSMEAPLDLFGRFSRLSEAARARAKSADAAGREQALDLRYRVTEAYCRAAISREVVAVVETALAAAASREAEVEARVGEGAALRADLLRVRARRREREAELAARQADQAGADALLNELLGADGDTTFVPSDPPTPPSGALEEESVLVAKALNTRPVLEAFHLQAEAAALTAQADHKSRLPEVGVFAQLSDDRGGFAEGRRSYAVGALVRLSVFDPSQNARQAEAQLNARAVELDRLAVLDEVRRTVRSAREQVRARRAAVDAARGGTEEGREALRVVQERRREGLATLTDELETEAAALGAQLRELSAQIELTIAEAVLARVTGETK